MAKFELRIIIFISLGCLVGYGLAKTCQAKEDNLYKLFASKTAYNQIRGRSAKKIAFPGCSPIQFYFISRHGTRYPKADDIKKMKNRLPIIKDLIISADNRKGKLCNEDIDNFKSWDFNLMEDQDNKLSPSGENELRDIGIRYRTRLATFIQKLNLPKNIELRTTTTDRTHESGKYFMNGLLGDEAKMTKPIEDNDLLRFYKECQLWNRDVDDNKEAVVESNRFKKGSKMLEVVKDVSKRLGLKNQLTSSDINMMYDACRYETAWDEDDLSPWCAAFEKDDLKVLEYSEDIKYYYKHGYGHTINYQQACPPIKDMVDGFMSKISNNQSKADILLRFSHSGMMLKLLARLGMFKDNIPLTSENYKNQKNRVWRTSRIDSFSANLAMVLFDCNKDHKIAAYFQEKEIVLPGCSSSLCPMSEFLNKFKPIADKCNLSTICNI